MPLVRGQVVVSKAGRDSGRLLAVTEVTEKGIFVCDGKERPLERPKLKNPKHVSVTAKVLTAEQLLTNKSVLHGLRDLSRTVEGDE